MNLPDLRNMKTKHSRLNPGPLTTSVASLTLLAQTVTAQQWTTNEPGERIRRGWYLGGEGFRGGGFKAWCGGPKLRAMAGREVHGWTRTAGIGRTL